MSSIFPAYHKCQCDADKGSAIDICRTEQFFYGDILDVFCFHRLYQSLLWQRACPADALVGVGAFLFSVVFFLDSGVFRVPRDGYGTD